MYIEKVSINNYRGIKSGELDTTSFNCIIGENNAGKSTILLAISLFFSGTSLSHSDFYDKEEEIVIDVTFSNVKENDVNRLAYEHKTKIKEIIYDEKLYLSRVYGINGKSRLRCYKRLPNEEKFRPKIIDETLKGKTGMEIVTALETNFPDYIEQLNLCKTQKSAKEELNKIIDTFDEDAFGFFLEDLPSGFDNSIKSEFLPEPVYIAAVKDFKDDIKTSETTSFGKLLSILLKVIQQSNDFETISSSFDYLHKVLNKDVDNRGEVRRNNKIQEIENQVQTFLQESFPSSQVEIFVPKPELKQIFANAKILIDDGVKDAIETKGDGIKRATTFALLRTFVEQKLIKEGNIDSERIDQPYVFLFEEPELYLHPNAQKVLFEALEKLSIINHQVFVTTHSPLFFSP